MYMNHNYHDKYIKYKAKYIKLQNEKCSGNLTVTLNNEPIIHNKLYPLDKHKKNQLFNLTKVNYVQL